MTTALSTPVFETPRAARPSELSSVRDYDIIRRIIEHISTHYRKQPSLEELAGLVALSPAHLQKLFTRWAGLSPKAFLQAVTLDHARRLLEGPDSLLDVAYDLGLSGPGRLHDLLVTAEAMSPGAYKEKGKGLDIFYGLHASPFGLALLMVTKRGLAGLAFAETGQEEAVFDDMAARWPQARYISDPSKTAPYAQRIFAGTGPETQIRIVLIGTDFEVRVWQALLEIPSGSATTYSAIAETVGKPKAVRAVGAAVGKNPISFVVPCHRVLGKDGSLTGYHWGLTRKRAILGWEAGQLQQRAKAA